MTQLRHLTTLRLGGPAEEIVTADSEAELIDLVGTADASGRPVLVLGGGSNVVVADEGFPGVVALVRTTTVSVDADACSGAMVTVGAGVAWDDFVSRAIEHGWSGVEALSGIPGSVGATPIQNVGAYGQEVAQTIASVRTFDRRDRRIRTIAAADCGFGYRTSRFKQDPGRHLVLSVTFQLPLGELSGPIRYAELAAGLGVEIGDRAPAGQVREVVLALRRGKGMVLDPEDHDTWSAGSFFTNPVVAAGVVPAGAPAWPGGAEGLVKTSAAWLIERAGFTKGYGDGPARLSAKHTLALTNRGAATTRDLLLLATEIQRGVRDRFGIELHNEPVLVGCELPVSG